MTGPVLVNVMDGDPMETSKGELLTDTVALGPAAGAVLPTASAAVPAANEILRVPSPVIEEIVTVLVVVPEPDTLTVPFAAPVLLSVTLAAERLTVLAPP